MIDPETEKKIKPGAVVRVHERVSAESGSPPDARLPDGQGRAGASPGKEKEKERISQFQGLVIARKHGSEPGASFTVRTTVAGVGVEKVYPIHSPMIAKVDVVSFPRKVHRAKLYYLRTRSKKEIRQKMGV